MSLKLITPPDPIVTWGEANVHLRLDGDTDRQAFVESLIAAATQHLDGWTGTLGRALGIQTWELYLDRFPCGPIKLPLAPLIEVEFVDYDDADSNNQTIDPSNYEVDDKSTFGWVAPASSYSWPSPIDAVNAVRVRFQCGYETVPAPIKAAILLMVAHWFENREAVTPGSFAEMPIGVDRLLLPYRTTFFA